MKMVVCLILVWTCISTDANNEGPSNYLKSKWRENYFILNQSNSTRCFRMCSSNEDDLFISDTAGKAAFSLSESRYMEFLIRAYTTDKRYFIASIQNTTMYAILQLDADQNGFISAEEFYTEHLCKGYKLNMIKKMFDALKPTSIGIPNFEIIDSIVQLTTKDNGHDVIYDASKNTTI